MIPERDRLARRVLHRHLRAVSENEPEIVSTTVSAPDSFTVLYSDGGTITGPGDLARLLYDRLGPLRGLRFLAAREGRNVVRWTATTSAGDPVGGRLVLHASVANDRVVSWATIEIDDEPKQGRTATKGPRATLEEVAARVREIIHHVTHEPTYSPVALVSELVAVVDQCEDQAPDDEGEV
jgi:hypothetical protein